MGPVHHPDGLDDRQARAEDRSADAPGDLELPCWEEFAAARERFFAGLRSAAALYRDGEVRPHDPGDGQPQSAG